MLNKKIENLAYKLLNSLNISKASEIDLQYICKASNISLRGDFLENNVSGLLVLKNNTSNILYNNIESIQRQRFTIAHELGHFFLHKDSAVFVDTNKVLYRNGESSKGEIKKEIEANSFAAALLMPEQFIIDEIDKLNKFFIDVDDIERLADTFKVSVQAMSFRLSNLGFSF